MDIELETGTCSGRSRRHRHNGYWGDFTGGPPMPWEQLRRVMDRGLRPPLR